jgi:hypothetical protein
VAIALKVRYISVAFAIFCNVICYMSKTKTATLNLRIDPRIKEGIRIAANKDHRSVANMVEMLIRRHCADSGIPIPEQNEMFPEKS